MKPRRSPLVPVLAFVVLLGGAVFGLSTIDASKPLKPVEKVVPADALAK